MRVLLFRHGPAGERDPLRWPDDRDRPLTDKGAVRSEGAARGLCALERRISVVLTSPLRRADDTARVLAGVAGLEDAVETLEALAPGGSWREVMTRLQSCPADSTVVLVGHEPDLGKLAGVLLFGAPTALALKKAGACAIAFDGRPDFGAGALRWFLPPRALRRLAPRKGRT
jgi:phosphohistidine phosphatase